MHMRVCVYIYIYIYIYISQYIYTIYNSIGCVHACALFIFESYMHSCVYTYAYTYKHSFVFPGNLYLMSEYLCVFTVCVTVKKALLLHKSA
jgi:hypothetical protein